MLSKFVASNLLPQKKSWYISMFIIIIRHLFSFYVFFYIQQAFLFFICWEIFVPFSTILSLFFFFFFRKILTSFTIFFCSLSLLFWQCLASKSLHIFIYVKKNYKKLSEELKMLQVNMTMIYIILKISVLLQITKILKHFLRSIIHFNKIKNLTI